jgi:hypothetical protein
MRSDINWSLSQFAIQPLLDISEVWTIDNVKTMCLFNTLIIIQN